MWFWWFMLSSDLLIPILMIFAGRMMWKHMPKNINGMIGYRTGRSMKNMDTWKFAHNYCGKLWYKIGWAIFFPCIILHLPFYRQSTDIIAILGTVLCPIQIVILLVSIFLTEHALKKNFTDEGMKKNNP